eukprot:TRINITY_DN111841_c0_g1_i1.p1 TRINITY_DN111841_c0_g1~~TRINITY_DN111841_c0_g1_i1.p1  ORF type:complete len:205 (-),score=46.33 TRINITY_DN111841_c0_g1_i1:163-777(-)
MGSDDEDRNRDRRGDRDRREDRDRDRRTDREDRDRDRDRDKENDAAGGPIRSGGGAVPRAGPYDSEGKGKGKGYHREPAPPRRHLDRSKTCPFLLRIFRKINEHHGIEAFAKRGEEPVDEELQVYCWPDVTLRELSDLVKDVAPEARTPGARLSFRLIYPDKTGKNVSTDLGSVTSLRRGPDDDKQLCATKFQTGDLLDLAIFK